ncbi:hypothetical protein J2S20_000600 [Moryella indoligenes]|uniref:Uncharacterized protein n=1 Tax=Moryella indoligenes TaxID=371674 RepID=A0AAE3V928_9FIRM|nr:hypothetical protein [Moryella indoligenes]
MLCAGISALEQPFVLCAGVSALKQQFIDDIRSASHCVLSRSCRIPHSRAAPRHFVLHAVRVIKPYPRRRASPPGDGLLTLDIIIT